MFDTNRLSYDQERFEEDDQNGPISGVREKAPTFQTVHLSKENKAELNELFHRAELDPYAGEHALQKVTQLVRTAKSKSEKEAVLTANLEKVFHLAEVIEGQSKKDLLRSKNPSALSAARNNFIRFFNAEMLTEIAELDQFYQQKTQKFLTKFLDESLSIMSDHEIRRFLHKSDHNSGLQKLLANYYEQIILDGHLQPAQEGDFAKLIKSLQRHDSPEKNPSFDLLDNKLTRFVGIPAQPDLTKNKLLSRKAIEATLQKDGFHKDEIAHGADQILKYIAKLN